MPGRIKTALMTALFIAAAAHLPAQAEIETRTFTDADTLMMRDLIATVSIITGDTDEIIVTIDHQNPDMEPVLVRQDGGKVELYSDEKPDQRRFWNNMNWHKNGDDTFRVFLQDYPIVQVTMPAGTGIEIDGIAAQLTTGNTDGPFDVRSTIYVEGKVGNVERADIRITGGGDLGFASVAEELEAKIAGSGTLTFNTVQSADLGIAGSGDIEIVSVNGSLTADIRGSGDIDVGDINGDTELRVAGSGDIETGKIKGGADISIRGSGDVTVSEVNGKSTVAITGNGDVEIRRGRAEDLRVSITGSGDLEFNGTATNPDITVTGNGDVYIRDFEGTIRTSGSGDVTLGDTKIKGD